ncbi:carbohydrate-binding protein [Microbacterium sp. J1-1]|uniref:carbohydrate-binding protein n=1 Tax=Microbacterium sp. J1-1 TaxID=2992441 RepID=UPI002114234D|nr:carbohydrate-binding protein [Microbacterium sp. J1-1]UUE20033.1 carbohydrate-binding protein [Microbacterium sp. J1-1]
MEQVESFDPYRTFEAETLPWQLGITTIEGDADSVEFPEHNGSGNMVLSGVDDGDFSGISGVDFGSGARKVSATVKPLAAGGSIQVRLDDVDGAVVAEIPVDGTIGEWTTVEAEVTGATGEHDVFFVFAAAEGADVETDVFEVDNWAFTPIDDNPGTELNVRLSVDTAAAGSTVTVTATGVTSDEVEIGIESTYRALATATAVAGRIQETVTIPADMAAGAHHIVLRDGETELARVPLTITRSSAGGGTGGGSSAGGGAGGSDGSLANTGGDASASLTAMWLGVLLLALGSGFWVLRRRGRAVVEVERE